MGEKKDKASDKKPPGKLRLIVGKVVNRVGHLCLPLSAGILLGFFLADREWTFLPATASVVATILIVGFISIPLGRILQGAAFEDTPDRRRIRRRVIVFAALGAGAILVRLAVFWMERPAPLTELTPEEFNAAFELDSAKYKALDAGMESALAFLEAPSPDFDSDDPGVLSPKREEELLTAWKSLYDQAFALDQIRQYYEDWFRFDPSRAQRSYHIRSFLLTYCAELALYEKATRAVMRISRNDNAVKFLDAPHPEEGLGPGSFTGFRQELQGTRDRTRVGAGMAYLEFFEKGFEGRAAAGSSGALWLWDRANAHVARIQKVKPMGKGAASLQSDFQAIKERTRRNWYPTQKSIAEWMGDTRVRRIGEYLVSTEQQAAIDEKLEPGDIMLSRKNWYLSNVGLPGFWPHAILYIGDADKLDRYFDDPEVKAYLAQLTGRPTSLSTYLASRWPRSFARYAAGHEGEKLVVIEAVSEGVIFNSLNHCAGDYLAAMRPNLSKRAKAMAVIEAFSHLDKPYDFDFDFATDHALVCTELVWRSYRPAPDKPGLDFETVTVLGRQTLPANDIARIYAEQRTSQNPQLKFVLFYDANEQAGEAFESSEKAFAQSHLRPKWDLALP